MHTLTGQRVQVTLGSLLTGGLGRMPVVRSPDSGGAPPTVRRSNRACAEPPALYSSQHKLVPNGSAVVIGAASRRPDCHSAAAYPRKFRLECKPLGCILNEHCAS